jgi:hypothetical protein
VLDFQIIYDGKNGGTIIYFIDLIYTYIVKLKGNIYYGVKELPKRYRRPTTMVEAAKDNECEVLVAIVEV